MTDNSTENRTTKIGDSTIKKKGWTNGPLNQTLEERNTHTNVWTKEPLWRRFGLGGPFRHRTIELFR